MRLPGPEFLALAYRLDAYGGVMTMRVRQQHEQQRRNVAPGARLVDSDARTLASNSALSELIEVG